MDEKMNWGFLILIFLFFIVFFGGNGFGIGNRAEACGCGVVSNCQIEKQEIIDSARTQYLIEQKAAQTQEMTMLGFNNLGTKIDYYAYEGLKDQLAQERAKNTQLQLMAYIESKDCAINSRLDAIQCQMLKQPPVWGRAFACDGNLIPPAVS